MGSTDQLCIALSNDTHTELCQRTEYFSPGIPFPIGAVHHLSLLLYDQIVAANCKPNERRQRQA